MGAMKENACSEQSARMTAMDNASKNAGEMIDKLQVTYNRTRQAVITKELIEIISGRTFRFRKMRILVWILFSNSLGNVIGEKIKRNYVSFFLDFVPSINIFPHNFFFCRRF